MTSSSLVVQDKYWRRSQSKRRRLALIIVYSSLKLGKFGQWERIEMDALAQMILRKESILGLFSFLTIKE
jgi:hypothetical protein